MDNQIPNLFWCQEVGHGKGLGFDLPELRLVTQCDRPAEIAVSIVQILLFLAFNKRLKTLAVTLAALGNVNQLMAKRISQLDPVGTMSFHAKEDLAVEVCHAIRGLFAGLSDYGPALLGKKSYTHFLRPADQSVDGFLGRVLALDVRMDCQCWGAEQSGGREGPCDDFGKKIHDCV